ncbi:MAG: VCBS repeat-containing protein, partial [Deltaproteobacteria bacterium]|nr:VCBS repeat-containing protein [Deltaproteobacteria bacterium]
MTSGFLSRVLSAAALATIALSTTAASADGSGEVDTFYGSFGSEVPIEVPPFHGLEPRVKLAYASSGGGGFVGVGWALSGFGAIGRESPGGGTPRYDGTDVFNFDGQELVPCVAGSSSPSCLAGGTHSTRIESYAKIKWDAAANTWTVWQKDGTRATYAPVYVVGTNAFRWGLVSVSDTHANTVNYGWWCEASADCYPDNISYAGTVIRFHREARPDPLTFGNGGYLGRTNYRLKSIDVVVSGSRARAYRLSYGTSASTGRSVLTSVQKVGSDAAVDGAGNVASGSALPAMSFGSTSASLSFSGAYWAGHGGGSTNNFVGDYNGDGKMDMAGYAGGGQWHVCLSTGSGFNCAYWAGHAGGSTNNFNGDYNGDGKTDMAGYAGNGQWHVCLSTGGGFSCAYWGGHGGGTSNNALGDFNGDGKTDMAGYAGSGQWHVCLSTGTSFSCPTYWGGHAGGSENNALGDYNGDGKTDMAGYAGSGQWHVTLAAGGLPDLLGTVSNGLGGSTSVTYTPSSAWVNTNRPPIVPTVSALTTTDGRGATGTTSYRYEGGLWSSTERRFLGFRKVTGVIDGAGNYT